MTKITEARKPKRGEIDYWFIAGDWHSEHLSLATYEILKQHAKLIPKANRKLIINGDFLDCVHLMGKKQQLDGVAKCVATIEELLIPASEEEFSWGNEILDECQKIFSEIIFIEGNHDWRYGNFVSNYCPIPYRHNFDLKLQLGLEDRGIKFIGYNDWLDIGHVCITHGMFHGTTALNKHFMATGKNTIFSHVHHADSKTFFHRGHRKKVWSLPCMSKLNPDYVKNRDLNWSNGYGFLAMKHDGIFSFYIHEVFENELILPHGKLLRYSD